MRLPTSTPLLKLYSAIKLVLVTELLNVLVVLGDECSIL